MILSNCKNIKMKNFGEYIGPVEMKDEDRLIKEFTQKLAKELAIAFEHQDDYLRLEKSLLGEWQLHPHWREYDYLCHEPLNLEKLSMALAVWKSLPVNPTERILVLDEIVKHGPKDSSDQQFLAVQCFQKYHVKNLLLLERHWHNCFPGTETQVYDPGKYRRAGKLSDQYVLNDLFKNLDEALLYVDVPPAESKSDFAKDGRRRFAIFRDQSVNNGLLTVKEGDFMKDFFEPLWKKSTV